MFSISDHQHMARALQLAERGLYTAMPNPRVGCVLVKDGVVVGEGWHERVGEPHAEINALRAAGDAARGATAFVTLEPCSHHGRTPPCADALIAAGVARVVVAMQDPNPQVAGRGLALMAEAGIAIEVGLMAAEAGALNVGFVSRMTRGRPWLRLKTASSLDGKTALANGVSQWITGPAARADVQRLRARACAVLTGIGTVLADDPQMTLRDFDTGRQPLRIVVDSHLRTPPTARIVQGEGAWIVCAEADRVRRDALLDAGALTWLQPGADGRVDLPALMTELAGRGINELHVEAGATLNGALLAAGLVDEWIAYLAPSVMGDPARGLFALPEYTQMSEAHVFRLTDVRQLGDNVRLTLRPGVG
ncbi:MAG: bifunctional diaminohydroxyphosphoribosylaminopyrimidine deaminase/5-amino-6-(5-phosphoribosylamino)uracil reductase RibD [Betaproteobacteria bacterium]|nr:MAG: bifunctional diaminohydroxyphosphoribosylaminopyrimidine deaminase/5-amino-6-(5-phosphoribosylamino)uracil reductase RibD [Betaproteobacteria bacterium]